MLEFCIVLILRSSSPRDCEMIFIIGRGFAELQILKMSSDRSQKCHSVVNHLKHFDKLLHTH